MSYWANHVIWKIGDPVQRCGNQPFTHKMGKDLDLEGRDFAI
jgi:hypothetical protein